MEVKQKLEDGLRPFTKPREQVNYIRRVLALHLGEETQSGPPKHPLSLAGSSHDARVSSDDKGIYKEYLEASKAHAAARLEFDAVSANGNAKPTPDSDSASGSEVLEEQLDLLKLRQKYERLLRVQEHLETLSQKPASSPDFVEPVEIFQGAPKLPKIPDVIVGNLVVEQSGSPSDLKTRIHQLERTALKAKLLLRQQEQLLKDAKARSKRQTTTVSSHAERLKALHATRSELINWMEAELSKASSDETETVLSSANQNFDLKGDQFVVETKLADIREKYSTYLELRKSILALVADRPQPSIRPKIQQDNLELHPQSGDLPVDYLLTPYVENLSSLSKSLKANIGQKTHMHSVLGQQIKDTQQALHHLAEESQLLPAHPSKNMGRVKDLISNEPTAKANNIGLSSQIRPWVLAADSAKIDTLETVTETVETGQVALENFMRQLQEINQLLGRNQQEKDRIAAAEGSQEEEDDLWLGNAGQSKNIGKRHAQTVKSEPANDIWSRLHGNLGLIGHDEPS
jgi:hypothetical protein